MILEIASLKIDPAKADAFEAAFPEAVAQIAAATGYGSHRLNRCIEEPGRYALLIHWRTLEDHTVGFRQSPAFTAWRQHLQPFLQAPPEVLHYVEP